MNSLMKRFLLCPVPDDQKPINQYIESKENFLTNWLFQKPENNRRDLRNLIYFSFLSSLTLQFQKKLNILTAINWISLSFLLLCFILLIFSVNALLRWREISQVFQKSSVIYEEASWFDTQCWEKPFFLIRNDTFLATQKLRPQLQSLSKFTWKIFLVFVLFYFLLNFIKIATII